MWQPFAVSALETKRALDALHAEQVAARRGEVGANMTLASLELGAEIGRAVLAVGRTRQFCGGSSRHVRL